MNGLGAANGKAILRNHRAGPLCWAARLLSVGYGLLIALYALGVFVAASVGGGISGVGTAEWVVGLFLILLWFIPFALAIVAWRWHLLGGSLISAGSVALYLVFAHAGSITWGTYLHVLPLLAGGLLHMVAWHMEKRAEQVPLPT